jgi:hypothetical protein
MNGIIKFKLVSGEYPHDFITLIIKKLAQQGKPTQTIIAYNEVGIMARYRFLALYVVTPQLDAFYSVSGGGVPLLHLHAILNVYQTQCSQYH